MKFDKNDTVVITIEDIGNEGEGIGKVDGYTLFVKDAIVGDVVEARIIKTKKSYGYGRLEQVIKASPFRVEPKCAFHKQCGGCQIQALSYDKQLEFKENKVRNNLMRIGGFEETFLQSITEPIIGMENPFYYRNKAQFPIGTDKDGNLIAGFYAGRTHCIIANTDCALGAKENQGILEAVLAYMQENQVSAYQEETGKGLVRHVLIRKGFATGQLMVSLIINGTKLPRQEKLLERLEKIPGMTSVSINTNIEKTNVIMGTETRTIWGEKTILDSIKGIQFKISPLSFYQVNQVQTEKLYSIALEYADLQGKETVWDLYCGIGTISLFLAQKAKKVYGVEVVPQAIEDARENARLNGFENTEFFVGKAEEVLPEQYDKNGVCADVIVVDPPRKGCDEICLQTMIQMQPQKIIYVSCDSATLARDLKVLKEGGYELKRVQAVDQFPNVVHVETVVLLVRKIRM